MAVGSRESLSNQTIQKSGTARDNKGKVCRSSGLETQSPVNMGLSSKDVVVLVIFKSEDDITES